MMIMMVGGEPLSISTGENQPVEVGLLADVMISV